MMAIEALDAPEGNLETPAGLVRWIVNTADHVYVTTGEKTGPLTVNRVAYHVGCHFHLAGGEWKLQEYRDLYMRRWNGFGTSDDVSAAAHDKMLLILTTAWSEFFAQHPDLLIGGELHALTSNARSTEEEIAKLETALKAQHAEMDKTMQRLRELGWYGPNKQDWSARY